MSTSCRAQRGTARTKRPERTQVEMRFLALDQMLESDHRARLVWQYVESLDLSELYAEIRAVEGSPGRDRVDPQILFALWLFATLEGVSSARRLAVLTERDIPYMWICGGVSVNYHLLSDFRVAHGDLLEQLLVDSIGVLLHQELITLQEVAQDGMRVRANAGSGSFRSEETLEKALTEAKEYVDRLKQEHESDPSGEERRKKAAEKRAAEDRLRRIEQAQKELEQLKSQRAKQRREPGSKARSSTTDPEARRMKMGDGGFRPALNVQFVTDCQTRMIVGVDVNNQGSDSGLMQPMHEQLQEDYGQTPEKYLVDGGFAKCDDVTSMERDGTQVYAPLPREEKHLSEGKDPYARKGGDSDEMAAFRQRMGTPEAKETYKQRCSVAEFPNADCRNRGLHQFRVRGCRKAKAQTMWHVLAFNLLRMVNLGFLDKPMTTSPI